MGWIVDERKRAPGGGSCHDVQVVERIAGRGDARPVVAPWNQEHVSVTHGDSGVDRGVVRVGAMDAVALGRVFRRPGPPHPEVVDLLVLYGTSLGVVVLVRRVRGPVAVGSQKL